MAEAHTFVQIIKNKMDLLKWFIGIMILLWLVWFFTGGPARYEREHSGPYIKPAAPLDTGEKYGNPDEGYRGYFSQ